MADELITIATFRDLPDALLAQGRLQAAGIDCMLADENMVRMNWFLSSILGGIKLQVAEADADAARDALNGPIPESFALEGTGEEFQQPRCPKCGSLRISYLDTGRWVSLAILWATSLPLPLWGGNWQCDDCGARWVVEDKNDNAS